MQGDWATNSLLRSSKRCRYQYADDVLKAGEFEGATDIILFDAKPPRALGDRAVNGVSFDWTAISSL